MPTWQTASPVLAELLEQGRYLDFVRAVRGAAAAEDVHEVRRGGLVFSGAVLDDIREAGDDGEGLYNLAAAMWNQSGGELEALTVFGQSLEHGYLDAALALGEGLLWMGSDERAGDFLKLTLGDERFDTPWRDGLLGEHFFHGGEYAEALTRLRRGYASRPTVFGLSLAKTLLALDSEEQAREVLVYLVGEDVYGAAILLGNLLDEHGDHNGALIAYRRGVEQGDAHSAFNLGLLHHELGDRASASVAFACARQMGDLTMPPEGYRT